MDGKKVILHREVSGGSSPAVANCTVPSLLYKSNPPLANIIHILPSQSIPQGILMSLSSESLNLRRKRTATERAENNGDPLAANKKARAAAKSQYHTSAPTQTSNSADAAVMQFFL